MAWPSNRRRCLCCQVRSVWSTGKYGGARSCKARRAPRKNRRPHQRPWLPARMAAARRRRGARTATSRWKKSATSARSAASASALRLAPRCVQRLPSWNSGWVSGSGHQGGGTIYTALALDPCRRFPDRSARRPARAAQSSRSPEQSLSEFSAGDPAAGRALT